MTSMDTKPVASSAEVDAKGVLVVEDDAALARSMSRILTSAGFDVSIAHDGDEALQKLSIGAYEVILTDIELPKTSGVDLLRIIRAYDLDVPVILMTGSPRIETATEAVQLGALQYLVKPVQNEQIVDAVRRASRLHKMARIKREALRAVGGSSLAAGDLVGLEACFSRALETVHMVYQPLVTPSGGIFGYEALLRSTEPSLSNPGALLAAAERLNRLHDLGRRVRTLSANAFARAPAGTSLFVNLHTNDLLDSELFEAGSPLSKIADRVVLEVTERATIENVVDINARISVLRYLGYRIAVDDLGAGYAGLTSFAALEPEIVKLDMSLVRDIHNSTVRQRIVGSMVSLCKELEIQVVAEGVETQDERDVVCKLGCDILQGYFFARPGPPFPELKR
jgi:EAL domain-containing protein (putative c-di-GMP-specific phosphodiesterase class I)